MKKLIKYLKTEGMKATLKKIRMKVKNRGNSTTVFLVYDIPSTQRNNQQEYIILELDRNNVLEFEKIKFWDHINAADYIDNEKRKILLVQNKKDEYIAYAAMEEELLREIVGCGKFQLQMHEAWIGPVYVKKEYRGRGINSIMIQELLFAAEQHGIKRCYTSVNSDNISSLKSFKKNGFEEIGRVEIENKKIEVIVGEGMIGRFIEV